MARKGSFTALFVGAGRIAGGGRKRKKIIGLTKKEKKLIMQERARVRKKRNEFEKFIQGQRKKAAAIAKKQGGF